ncbi:MAG: biotin/lipoyl-containing protein [Sphingomicrobium sp.]
MAEPGKNQAKEGPMRIDAKLVQELADLLTANGLTEIQVEDGDRRIKVCRDLSPVAPAPAAAPAPAGKAHPVVAPTEEVSGETIKSPMVGTAFLSSEPGADPFIAVGKPVKAGDTLLIIEAMKVMNPITALAGGVIKKIMVADAQPVEFDQPLVIIG